MSTIYDEVEYPSKAFVQTEPDHLATVAALHGFAAAPPEGCRVLELGCNDGSNLIPLALNYPRSSFVGLDLAGKPIAAGLDVIDQLGLENIRLIETDLMDWDPGGAEFDYIIAHGLFSWVPEAVRQAILSLCGQRLSARGIAFISYNAFPGCHYRRYLWDMMKFHTRNTSDPSEKLSRVHELASSFLQNLPDDQVYKALLKTELETFLERHDHVIFHDDLAGENRPYYLSEFVEAAGRHGLQYLADTDLNRDDVSDAPVPVADWLSQRQYLDYFAGRRFRETLLCRRGRDIAREPILNCSQDLRAASNVVPQPEQANGSRQFQISEGKTITTNHPAVKRILCRLSEAWPASLPLGEIAGIGPPPETLSGMLLQLFGAGVLELRSTPPKVAAAVSSRPEASPLARLQIAGGRSTVTNQRHREVCISDDFSRQLVLLLDGSRDRAAILEALAAAVESGIAIPHPEGTPAGSLAARRWIEQGLDEALRGLVRSCLLVH